MRVLLMLLLMAAVAPAWAAWVRIASTNTAVHYIDPATIRQDGNFRRVWAMQDMRQTSPDGVRSIRVLEEYDCAAERFRYLTVSAHSGPMAGGATVLQDDLDDEWNYRPADTYPSSIERIVCAP